MYKKIALLIVLILAFVGGRYIFEFYHINKDLFPFIERDEIYPTAREVFNDDPYADVIKVDHYMYVRNRDWRVIVPKDPDPEAYHKDKDIGEVKKTSKSELWFRNFYASKLAEGTTLYADDRDYRKGDAPSRITIEEDGKIVFYEKMISITDEEDRDPAENDPEIQKDISEKISKINDDIEITKANIIDGVINIDVASDYLDPEEDDMEAYNYRAFEKGIEVANIIGQSLYLSRDYDWDTLSIYMNEFGTIDMSHQLYVGMEEELEEAVGAESGYYTNRALTEEILRTIDWKMDNQESHINSYVRDVLE